MTPPPVSSRFMFPKLGLKLLAVVLGIMAWYLIQDAIRIEGAQRKATLVAPPAPGVDTNQALRLPRIPITVLGRPGAWEWQLDTPLVSTVWLRGSREELDRIDLTTVRVFVDGSIIVKTNDFISVPLRVYVPGDVRLKTYTEPERVRVSLKPAVKGGL